MYKEERKAKFFFFSYLFNQVRASSKGLGGTNKALAGPVYTLLLGRNKNGHRFFFSRLCIFQRFFPLFLSPFGGQYTLISLESTPFDLPAESLVPFVSLFFLYGPHQSRCRAAHISRWLCSTNLKGQSRAAYFLIGIRPVLLKLW